MKTILKTVCDAAFTSKETGTLNIIGIFDNITAPNFPAMHGKMSFVFVLEDDLGKRGSYFFDITNSAGVKIFDTSASPKEYAVGPTGKINIITNLLGLKFDSEGIYTANFYFDGHKESIELKVLSNSSQL